MSHALKKSKALHGSLKGTNWCILEINFLLSGNDQCSSFVKHVCKVMQRTGCFLGVSGSAHVMYSATTQVHRVYGDTVTQCSSVVWALCSSLNQHFFLSRLYICSLNIYICQTNHVPTHRRHPTLTQPAPCSLSSLLSWLQSEANLLQGLTSSAQTALQHGWMICLNQAAVINNEGGNCHKTTKQSNDMYWYVCRTITNKVCKCSMTCWSAYLHIQ